MAKLKLKIDGMHCTSCALNIDMDLEDQEGIISSRTNYAKSETEVEFDPDQTDSKKIIQTIQTTGYKSEPL